MGQLWPQQWHWVSFPVIWWWSNKIGVYSFASWLTLLPWADQGPCPFGLLWVPMPALFSQEQDFGLTFVVLWALIVCLVQVFVLVRNLFSNSKQNFLPRSGKLFKANVANNLYKPLVELYASWLAPLTYCPPHLLIATTNNPQCVKCTSQRSRGFYFSSNGVKTPSSFVADSGGGTLCLPMALHYPDSATVCKAAFTDPC